MLAMPTICLTYLALLLSDLMLPTKYLSSKVSATDAVWIYGI